MLKMFLSVKLTLALFQLFIFEPELQLLLLLLDIYISSVKGFHGSLGNIHILKSA